MKIDVIIPSNNIDEINGFIKSFNKMKSFKKYCQLVIIGNGDLHRKHINYVNNLPIKFIRLDKDYSGEIIPFAKLRGLGMKDSSSDFFLFMDDDNRFTIECDSYFTSCVSFIIANPLCSVIQAERERDGPKGIIMKLDGFYWTGYGLFLKNIIKEYDHLLDFKGCCEETLYVYETLYNDGLPYIFYGNPTTRDKSLDPKWNENNNPSYSEEIIQDNIQGYIQDKYEDSNWRYYNNIPNNNMPNLLQQKINERISNEI